MSEHIITVEHSAADDGIYLHCSCGWRSSLYHSPTVEAVTEAAAAHHLESEMNGAAALDLLESFDELMSAAACGHAASIDRAMQLANAARAKAKGGAK